MKVKKKYNINPVHFLSATMVNINKLTAPWITQSHRKTKPNSIVVHRCVHYGSAFQSVFSLRFRCHISLFFFAHVNLVMWFVPYAQWLCHNHDILCVCLCVCALWMCRIRWFFLLTLISLFFLPLQAIQSDRNGGPLIEKWLLIFHIVKLPFDRFPPSKMLFTSFHLTFFFFAGAYTSNVLHSFASLFPSHFAICVLVAHVTFDTATR